jgi:hypothetical protein
MHLINTYLATVLVQTRSVADAENALSHRIATGEVSVGRSTRGWVELELTLEARSLSHACTTASALARAATGAEPIACHVITRAEHSALMSAAGVLTGGQHAAVRQVPEPARVPTPRASA